MRKTLFTLFLSMLVIISFAQQRVVAGKITDSDGKPMSGVSVKVKSTSAGTLTSDDGTYKITIPASAKILEFSTIGYVTQEVTIGNKSNISLAMTSLAKSLDEVVVVGYQSIAKKDVTGAISTISGSEVAQKPIGSVTQLLQGKAPGVQVTGQSGRPGANAFIRIRGAGSINASSEPLFILDGIPITAAAYNMINPNDLETFTVLKDAAAAAVYGARAANGVIVMTSKRGKAGQAEFKYSFQYGIAKRQNLKNVRLMNTLEKLRYEYEGNYVNPIVDSMVRNRVTAGTFPAGSTLFSLNDQQRQSIWDLVNQRAPEGGWEPVLFQDAVTKTHELSASGASDKFRYFFSLNKSDNEGTLYGSYWNRTSGRMNIEYNATNWLKIGTNLGVSFTKENQVREPFNTQNSNAAFYLINPYEPVRLPNGSYNPTFNGFNPLEGADFNPQELKRVSNFTTLFGEAKPIKNLTLKSQLGINFNMLNEEYYLQPGSNLANILGYNQKRVTASQDYLYVFTNTANWRQSIGSHTFSVLAGTEFTKDRFYRATLVARGFPTASVNTLDNAATPFTASTDRSDWALISYFGNVSYDFQKKYFITLSGRRDGSSRFGSDVKFANFWGIGLTWDVLKEGLLKWDGLNELRLRASYGTAGNNNIGNYDALGTYSLAATYNNQGAAVPARLPNPSLTWEQNENYDIGIDASFFNNRLNFKFDYYTRKTNDLLYPVNVSTTTGFASFTGNIGSLQNRGYEIELNGDIIRKKDLVWNVAFSYSNNDNKILSLYNDDQQAAGTGGIGRLKIGNPVNTFYLVRWAGVNPTNGKDQYMNRDGSLTESFPSGQQVLLEGKSPNVRHFGSLNTSITYKSLDVSAQFYYSMGNYIMNYMWQNAASNGENINIPQFIEASNYWKKPGDVVRYANLNDPTQRQTFDDDRWLQKGDYISLRDVTIGYTLPDFVFRNKKFVKTLRFFLQGTNLWIGSKFKGMPEVGQANSETGTYTVPGVATLYGFPQLTAYTFGLDIKF